MSGPRMQDFHRVEVRTDRATGLKAVFALHDLTLGPAAGGVRRWHYDSEDDAVADAMRLAEGMTCKNALAGLPFGGGKSVILSDGKPITQAQLRTFGRWLNQLGGEYVAAEDVGMTVEHMKEVRRERGTSRSFGCGETSWIAGQRVSKHSWRRATSCSWIRVARCILRRLAEPFTR